MFGKPTPKKPFDPKDRRDLAKLEVAIEELLYHLKHRGDGGDDWEYHLKIRMSAVDGRIHPDWYTFLGETPRERVPAS